MLIALLLTLCPFLGVFYMIRCMLLDARAAIRRADARRPVPPAPVPTPRVADDRPVYHVVELRPELVALMERDGFA